MTDRNNNFTPDGSEKSPRTETRTQRRERLEAEEKAEKLRAAGVTLYGESELEKLI